LFTGTGVTGTIPWAVANILTGSTGFVCTPVGPGASVVLSLS